MRILDVRDDHKEEDIQEGQKTLLQEIAHPTKTVMVIRKNTPDIALFGDKAATRSDPFPWREVVWVRDSQIFPDGKENEWFKGHSTACATIFDLNDKPVVWLDADASLSQIDRAFRKADSGSR